MSDIPVNDDPRLRETLSALMDGEAGKADQLELRRLARSLADHPELLDTYERYLRVRTTLRDEPALVPGTGFLASVRNAIDAEEAPVPISEVAAPAAASATVSLARPPRRWLMRLGPVAIAASVAILTVNVLQRPVSAPETQAPVAEASRETSDPVLAHGSRVLSPDVLTVSAGNRVAAPARETSSVMSGCVLDAHRPDAAGVLWEKSLPAGYAVCRQNPATHHCDVVSEKVGCYLR